MQLSVAKELYLSPKAPAPCGKTWEVALLQGWMVEEGAPIAECSGARTLHGHAATLAQRMRLPCRSCLFHPRAKRAFPFLHLLEGLSSGTVNFPLLAPAALPGRRRWGAVLACSRRLCPVPAPQRMGGVYVLHLQEKRAGLISLLSILL